MDTLNRTAGLRLSNLRALIEQHQGPNNLAAAVGYTNASFLVQMAGPHPTRPITERTARKIEAALSLPPMWLDSAHAGTPSAQPAAPPSAPPAGLAPPPPVQAIPAGLYPTEEDRQRLARNTGAIARHVLAACRSAGLEVTDETFGKLVALAVLDAIEHGEVRASRIAALVDLMQV